MNSTDWEAAAIFFAEWLLSLRHANERRRIHYLERNAPRESHWAGIATRTGGIEELPPTARAVPPLLESLGRYWGPESSLVKLLPQLGKLHEDLTNAAEDRGIGPALSEFTYPLS